MSHDKPNGQRAARSASKAAPSSAASTCPSALRQDLRLHQPGHRRSLGDQGRGLRRRADVDARRARPRAPPSKAAPGPTCAARSASAVIAEARRADDRRTARAGAARDARHGQADRLHRPRSTSRARPTPCSWFGEAIDKIYDEVAPTPRNARRHDHPRAARRRGRRRAVELPAADGLLEDRAGAGRRQLGDPEAGRAVAAHRDSRSPSSRPRPASRKACSTCCRASARPRARRSAATWTSTWWPSPARPRSASTSCSYSGESNMKQVWLECGGKSPNIVLADAPDLDVAAQRAGLRHLLQPGRGLHRGLAPDRRGQDQGRVPREGRCAIGRRCMPGDPLDPKTQMGAMVDETQTKRVHGLHRGRQEGRRRSSRCGGKRVDSDNDGCFVEPTMFDDVDQQDEDRPGGDLRPGRLPSIPVKDVEDAHRRSANDTIYGLAAAVWTSDINKAFKVAKAPARPARCGSTPTTAATSPRRSAATSSRASAATSRCTPSTSSPS